MSIWLFLIISNLHHYTDFIFICKYIPLKQWAYDDSHSPKYQKFKIDTLSKIICHKQDWQWSDLLSYYKARYNKDIKPLFRHSECTIPEDLRCLSCNAPVQYLMWNDGKKKSQVLCKICQPRFNPGTHSRFSKNYSLKCPHFILDKYPIFTKHHTHISHYHFFCSCHS